MFIACIKIKNIYNKKVIYIYIDRTHKSITDKNYVSNNWVKNNRRIIGIIMRESSVSISKKKKKIIYMENVLVNNHIKNLTKH